MEILRHFCERGNGAYLLVTHSKQKPVSRLSSFKVDSIPMNISSFNAFYFCCFLVSFFPFLRDKAKAKSRYHRA
jgi:hypothetical protein